MKRKLYFTSDWHIGHANVLKFDKRPYKDLDEMHSHMIKTFNYWVPKHGITYFLGDMGFGSNNLLGEIIGQLNGTKVLIRGNHDVFKTADFIKYFDEIYGVKVGTDIYRDWDFIMSHIPIHIESRSRWKANIHGHLHGNSYPEDFYMNVCVEHIDFTPKHFNICPAR